LGGDLLPQFCNCLQHAFPSSVTGGITHGRLEGVEGTTALSSRRLRNELPTECELCQLAKVLRGGSQRKFVMGTGGATQSKDDPASGARCTQSLLAIC
jgi:hypothetical protein